VIVNEKNDSSNDIYSLELVMDSIYRTIINDFEDWVGDADNKSKINSINDQIKYWENLEEYEKCSKLLTLKKSLNE
jgi:hypothetical protein